MWQYDVANIKCPVYNFQGEFDNDMGSSAPYTSEFLQQMVPHRRKIARKLANLQSSQPLLGC